MAETSFTTRHSGASVTCAGGLTMIHLFSNVPSEIKIVDSERGPVLVKVAKYAERNLPYSTDATVVYLDWETAKQVAELVSHHLEQADHEDPTDILRLVR
jgi:L-arabinose isomerase